VSRNLRPEKVTVQRICNEYLYASRRVTVQTTADRFNGRILLVIPFPCNTVTVTAFAYRYFWAFNDDAAKLKTTPLILCAIHR
jgi:hypothetical protein